MRPRLFYLFLLLFLSSCIYEPDDENYIELSKEVIIPAIENYSLDLEKDTVYIWSTTNIDFSFQTDTLNIRMIEVIYQDNSLKFYSSSGNFIVEPDGYDNGVYPLTIRIYTNSGTGSLADKVGTEAIVQERTWIMVFEKFYVPDIKFTHTSIESGHLAVHWEKCSNTFFSYYEIMVDDSALHDSYSRKIYDRNITSLVDSAFVGGAVSFSLRIGFKDIEGYRRSEFTDELNYKYPVRMLFTSTRDSLTISWNKSPFKHYASLYFNSSTIEVANDTTYTLKSPGIGALIQYQLSLKPTIELSYDHQKYYIYSSYTEGKANNMEFSAMKYFPALKTFIRKDPMFVRINDLSMTQTASYDYSWDYDDDNSLSLSPDQSILYTTVHQKLVSLNPVTLEAVSSHPLSLGGSNLHCMQIVNDSVLLLGYDITVALYNYKRHKIIDSVVIGYYVAQNYNFSASSDGKYIAYSGDKGLRIFANTDDKKLEPLLTQEGKFYSCLFDPVHPENLLVVTPDNNYFIRCTDMEVIKVIPEHIKGMPANFDPVTNYLLFVSYSYKTITVYDVEHDEVKYTCNHHGYFTDFYLGNNLIFYSTGYHVKIN